MPIYLIGAISLRNTRNVMNLRVWSSWKWWWHRTQVHSLISQWLHFCTLMCSKVSSDCLSNYIKATQLLLELFKDVIYVTERSHAHTHTHTHSLSLSHTHTHTLSLSLTHTHTHTHTLSLSHTHTHTHTLSLSLTHTHTSLSLYIYIYLGNMIVNNHRDSR